MHISYSSASSTASAPAAVEGNDASKDVRSNDNKQLVDNETIETLKQIQRAKF